MTVATERLPQPYVVDAVVSNDVIARTLTVRLSDAAGGYEKSLWLQAYQQLRAAEQSGSRGQQRTVWASAVGASRIAFATPDPDRQALLFHFQPGVAAYAALIGNPGLTATVAVDRSSGRFMSVRFRHRP
jgi:hypothetical protein